MTSWKPVSWARLLIFYIVTICAVYVKSETLTPPYFNLAEGKNITASATCGVDTEGPELYCKLIGANTFINELNVNVIQGQSCDYCDPLNPAKTHPPEYAVDGIDTWWQSPPLSRGMKYNEINLTIDLGQEFHVAYVYIKMANSPRPGLWILEKSSDYGKTFTPWQYFSDSPNDCEKFFGKESLLPITKDDSVICSTEYSKIVPLEGGEIPISLLNKRPSANHYFNSTVLQEWTRATNVRLRFLRTKNLLGHLMSVAKEDPTVTRRYFYSIKDISIGGRCMCNGHAQTCDILDPRDNRVLLCRCQHNTCGAKCDSCCEGFEQKSWRQSKHNDPFKCEPCNCFNHSNKCIYDKEIDEKRLSLDIHGKYDGGGVCQNCQHNTEGINCNKCKPKYFRPYNKHWNETDVCQPCNCNHFTSTGNCAEGSGRCECKKEYTSPNCDSCSFGYYDFPTCKPCECFLNGTENSQCSIFDGKCPCLYNFGGKFCKECGPEYYNFPECKRCECDLNGAESNVCEKNLGNCTCKINFSGRQCDQCKNGFYDYPSCTYCNCDIIGTKDEICNKDTGKCICKEGFSGDRCDVCSLGYYGYPDCKPCNCSKIGSHGTTCSATGKCSCLGNYAGRICDQCSPGYFNFPDCGACNCDTYGSNGISCNAEGICECLINFNGTQCNSCKDGYYNYPVCEDCNCHPAGVVPGFAGCGSVAPGELCQCKNRVEGRICDKCKPLYWNLSPHNPEGCQECNCNIDGVLGGIANCDSYAGQCVCKPSVIARDCSICIDGTYNLKENNLFGCVDCECDVGGSINNRCDKNSGNCVCQPRVTGRTCKEPLQAHYFPTLYQYQYEVEDGYTPENNRVRYEYNERTFANYSWKGYAVFSELQREVRQNINLYKPSLYSIVMRYVNTNPDTVIGSVKIIPDNPNDIEQWLSVRFKSSSSPSFVTVSGETGNTASSFVMNPGRWTISIMVNQSLLIDYFVLLPEDFYLATVLRQKIKIPCTLHNEPICRQYAYPNISFYDRTNGVGGYIQNGDRTENIREFFEDRNHLAKISVLNRVPMINMAQNNIKYNLTVTKPGLYVIVVNYITPLTDKESHRISLKINEDSEIKMGNLNLHNCPYTHMCRQVVLDSQGGVGFFKVDTNYLPIELKGENANVGIHSIYTIPSKLWSIEYIKPRPVCIKMDGKCIVSDFRNPPESKTIQFDSEKQVKLPLVENNKTTYVWLSSEEKGVDLKGKVPSPGLYTFIIHYYQPDFPEFDLSVIIQNGQFYEARVPIKHCPSISGCRSTVVQVDGNNKFYLTENFMITFKINSDNENAYLNYLLVTPADFYSEKNLEEEEELDRSGEFIKNCANNNFNIDTSRKGFCRDSVFSITAAHNVGALPCQCDFHGSLSFECEKFGGQCLCKPHIIGRKCEACKTGYYGFPDCKPCQCPSTAYCEPETGQCICPRNVIGEKCDKCDRLTYGFHPLIGCEECNCHPLGIEKSTQCDLFNGSCGCKQNVEGRTCSTCKPGFYAFPHCESCDCNHIGTKPEICDQDTAECFCKKNVVGPQCRYCREGTYNLDAQNPDGCTECYCFGKTSNCMSSVYSKSMIKYTRDWKIVQINTNGMLEVNNIDVPLEYLDEAIGADFTTRDDLNKTNLYFSAPSPYLGKMILSYGGYLNYTIFYTIGDSGNALSGADIILKGANSYLTYTSLEQPAVSQEYPGFVQILESNFNLPHGVPSKKEHLMEILRDLRGIYIRATYWTVSITTRIINPTLDSAIEDKDSFAYQNRAVTVEQCRCPPNYQGLSCEECAPGYFRVQSGSHGGYCQPCDCHGHATECDVNTGVCLNCTHNTKGDHCELCDVGYHGNALGGTPNDCLICACPLPSISNNFASSCDVSNDGNRISCECAHGYIGARCQSCLPGFFGQPEQPGDFCKPCQCSGNINIDEPGSCDTVTGECLKCLNNTFGVACALCKPGFFGDAVNRKDCQACICDKLGIDYCDSTSGTCMCKPNVVGEKCDRCAEEHFGFDSGRGCSPCNCSIASESTQCDDTTGQCKCKPGVTGTTCDRCQPGYWNFTSEGCISCRCKSEFSQGVSCNPRTGQCECMPGVIGEKCDQCPYRWVFTPNYGCHECDNCHYALLDTADYLGGLIDPIIIEFDSTNSGYFTRRRLESVEDLFKKIKPMMDEVDPRQINLKDYLNEIDSLEHDLKNLNRKSNYSLENSESLNKQSEKLHDDISELFDDILQAEEDSNEAIENIAQISFQMNDYFGTEIENLVQEGQRTFDQIKMYNLTSNEVEATKQLRKVNELLKNVTNFKLPSDGMLGDVEFIKEDLKKIKAKLDDIYNNTQYSINKANEADRVTRKTGKDHVKAKLESIENQVDISKSNILESENLLGNASKLLDMSQVELSKIQVLPDVLDARNAEFNSYLDSYKAIDDIYNKQPVVEERSGNLSLEAQEWSEVFSQNKEIEDAVKAGNAYQDIIKAVNSSRHAAEESRNDTSRASGILTDISDKTYEADSKSSDILLKAHSLKTNSEDKLGPILNNVEAVYLPIKREFDQNVYELKELMKNLENTQYKSPDMAYKNASKHSQTAENIISDIKKSNINFEELPSETEMVETLPKDHDELRRNLLFTDKQIVSVNDKLPEIINKIQYYPKIDASQKHKMDRVESQIKKLNQQIELARDIANKVKVGVRFYPNTTLELRNPDNLEQLSTSAKISGYFRTPKRDGLIFYLGNPNGTNLPKTKSDDYMALVIVNGYATLKFDLGNGPDQLINEKYVSDNVWYQFIIERIGHYATLTIREEVNRKEVLTKAEKPITGHYSIFNLDKEKSKLFVGSFPPTNYEIQKEISDFNSLEGEIEDLVIGDRPISLWNFNQGYENNHGAKERDKLVDLEPSTGFRFNGNGYAILNARSYPIRHKSDIHLAFKTFASEGLLLLAGNSNTFISLELRGGKVLYQYNLGSGTKKFYTSKTYNDGQWHKINAVRDGPKGKLIVDGEVELDVSKPIAGSSIEAIETISFGGYPNKHSYVDVTHTKFDGCINNVTIMGQTVDLRVNIKTFDVVPGCPDKFAPMVSFTNKRPGYIGWNRLSVSNEFKVALKFKTKEKGGLIFYVTDQEQSSGISLSLVDGRLKIISQKIPLVSKDTYNDMKWHVVSIMHNEKELRVDFDDYGYKVTDAPPPALHIIYGHMYIGGLPRKFRPLSSMVGSTVPFSGCITDLTVNGAVKNFANSTEKSNEYLASCVLDKSELENLDVHKLPVLPPLPDLDVGTTVEPDFTKGYHMLEKDNNRGDGGNDFVPSLVHNNTVNNLGGGFTHISTSKPPIKDGCALPAEPTYEGDSNGYRFGINEESRLEYLIPRGKFKKQCDFDLKIKTADSDGIILFISDQGNNDQYLALIIKDGYLIFTFNTTKGPVLIKTNNKYNDDKLHVIQLSRDEKNAKLVIDNTENLNYNGEFEVVLDLKPPFYVGGIPSKFHETVFGKLNITKTFSGCVQYLRMNGKPMENPEEYNVTPCSDNVEYGTFFAGDGYVKLRDKFKVGIEFDVKMDIKPRDVSGVILAVHGKKDYFVIEIIDGVLQATVDNNGKKPFKAISKTSKYHLCDGNWHSIQAVKSKNVITLSVDSVFTQPQLGDRHYLSTDTGSALFLGGHRFIKRIRGIQTKQPYIGCIRNIHINNEPAEILPNMTVGKVYAGSCRTN